MHNIYNLAALSRSFLCCVIILLQSSRQRRLHYVLTNSFTEFSVMTDKNYASIALSIWITFDDLYRISNFMHECMQGRAHSQQVAKVVEEAEKFSVAQDAPKEETSGQRHCRFQHRSLKVEGGRTEGRT